MRRSLAFAVLAFLLLFMQQEAQVHALSHLGQLTRSHTTEVVAPHADQACVECALLASGTGAAVNDEPSPASAQPAAQHTHIAFRSRAADPPSFFSSRAPPVLL